MLDRKQTVVLANRAFAEFVAKRHGAGGVSRHLAAMGIARRRPAGYRSTAPGRGLRGRRRRSITPCTCSTPRRACAPSINCAPVLGGDGKAGGVLVSVDDITEIEDRARKGQERRCGQPGKERLPGQHEPRDPHPDERHSASPSCCAGAIRGRPTPDVTSIPSMPVAPPAGSINDILDLSKVESGATEIETACLLALATNSHTRSSGR